MTAFRRWLTRHYERSGWVRLAYIVVLCALVNLTIWPVLRLDIAGAWQAAWATLLIFAWAGFGTWLVTWRPPISTDWIEPGKTIHGDLGAWR